MLNNDVSATTRDTIAKATTPEQMLALTLGSPNSRDVEMADFRTADFRLKDTMTSRRVFVKNGAFALVSLGFAPSFLARTAFAAGAAARAKRLIAIFQRGAVDGLNMIVPFGDKEYYRARPSIAIARPGASGTSDGALDLDGFFGFNPRLQPLKPFWDARQLAIVHACGSPDNTRSHFDAQDYMESATPGVKSTSGRLAESVPSGAARRRGDAVSRGRADAAAAPRAPGHRAGAGGQSARTVRDPRRPGERHGRGVLRERSSPPRPIVC